MKNNCEGCYYHQYIIYTDISFCNYIDSEIIDKYLDCKFYITPESYKEIRKIWDESKDKNWIEEQSKKSADRIKRWPKWKRDSIQ